MPHYCARCFSAVALLGFLGTAAPVWAQIPANVPYDGRAILARVRYPAVADPEACLNPDGGGDGGWSHDYPESVQGMMKASTEVTSLEAPVDSLVTILSVTEPLFMKYPVAMVTEPGCWNPNEEEVKALRTYVQKGGFLFIDDLTFSTGTEQSLEVSIERTERWLKRVLPEGKLMPVPALDPIFQSFFTIDPSSVPGGGASKGGTLYGIYRKNDPTGSLMLVVTYRGVLGHYWRWEEGVGSGLGGEQSPSGMAYRLGLNILIYGLSH